MEIKKYFDYYSATYKGEILEKVKRKILKQLKYYKAENLNVNSEKIKLILENRFPKKNLEFEKKIKIFEKIVLEKDNDWYLGNKPLENHWQYENINNYKDVKYIWEVNRLQYLINNFIAGKDENEIMKILEDWDKKNSYDIGINWFSNLEVAIRSLSILLISSLIKNNKNKIFINELLYKHAIHLYKDINFTEVCIPNNHLIGEATMLYCLSFSLKCKENKIWKNRAEEILKNYIHHFQEDGTYAEASLSYHRFTLQMYIMVLVFSKKNKDNFLETEIIEALKKSYTFFKSIKKPDGSYPDFGDNDHGYFYQIKYQESFENFVKSLGTLFENSNYVGELQLIEEMFDIKLNNNREFDLEETNYFPIGKYIVKKINNHYLFMNNQKQIHHSHSDGLNIELFLEGKNILVDSGTFSYNLDRKKRNWYRGTRSHNTVYMGENQAKEIGSFRWIKAPENSLNYQENNEKTIISGEVKTYKNKVHNRQIEVKNNFSEILIKDCVKNSDKFELNWHFNPDIEISRIDEKRYKINLVDYILEIESDFKIEINLLKSPYSKQYGFEEKRVRLKINNLENKEKYHITTKFLKIKGDNE